MIAFHLTEGAGPVLTYGDRSTGKVMGLYVEPSGKKHFKLVFYFQESGKPVDISNEVHVNNIKIKKWLPVAVTYDYNNDIGTIYVNGAKKNTEKIKPAFDLATQGEIMVGGFQGSLSCLQIFNDALDKKQVKALKTCPLGMYSIVFSQ